MKVQVDNGKLLHISDSMSGKMEGINSLSTSCLDNEFCQKMQKCKGLICHDCFSVNVQNRYKDLQKNLINNGKVLRSEVLTEFPKLNDLVFRIESFGETDNDIQAENYLRLIENNPNTRFGLWSKRMDIYKRVILERGSYPPNVTFMESSPRLNTEIEHHTLEGTVRHYQLGTFTVYTADYAIANGIEINCGNKVCRDCRTCYSTNGDMIRIREMLKSEQKKYAKMGGVIR